MLGNYVNDVSMEGFLLSPIQRMCKYPLLLKVCCLAAVVMRAASRSAIWRWC